MLLAEKRRQWLKTIVADFRELVTNIVGKTPDVQVMTDLDSTLAFAGRNGGNSTRAGITGFCWGGQIF